jgi:hypothetical protein
MFNDLSTELGEPNQSLLVAKFDNPTFSCGIRKKIIMINRILIINPIDFNIFLI